MLDKLDAASVYEGCGGAKDVFWSIYDRGHTSLEALIHMASVDMARTSKIHYILRINKVCVILKVYIYKGGREKLDVTDYCF